MSIDGHFKERGIELTEDSTLPQGQRTVKNFKRVIAAVRAAEAQSNDEIREANERCRRSQEQVILLQERLRVVENELKKYKLDERLSSIDALSVAERQRLLLSVTQESETAAA